MYYVTMLGWTEFQYLFAIELLRIRVEECESLMTVKSIWYESVRTDIEPPVQGVADFDTYSREVYNYLLEGFINSE